MIRINKPFTGEDELEEVRKVLESGYLTQGPKVAEFEQSVQAVVGSRFAFAMSSATTALHLSLVALGIQPGDEVAISDFTFPATGNVVIQQGARPICVDVKADTYAMDADDLASKITKKTRAIIPVHPFGLSADMGAILKVASHFNLPVIEDAACSLGALYDGRPSGTFGKVGCYSFHPRKSVTTGEGGMIVTDDVVTADRIKVLRSHGGVRGEFYFRFEDAGFNYRLSDIQAAVGVAQMRRLDWLVSNKRRLASQLSQMLSGVVGVRAPIEPENYLHTYQSYVVMLDEKFNRDSVIAAMRRKGVETTLGTYAFHAEPVSQRMFGYHPGDLPTSYSIYQHSLTLPLYPQMTTSDLEIVVEALDTCLREAGL